MTAIASGSRQKLIIWHNSAPAGKSLERELVECGLYDVVHILTGSTQPTAGVGGDFQTGHKEIRSFFLPQPTISAFSEVF